ncbi:MAG: CHAT domain-containing protein [Pleurocapsa sp.]
MFAQLKRRYWLLITCWLIGLFLVVAIAINFNLPQVLATVPPTKNIVETETNALLLEEQGKQLYAVNQFEEALNLWQKADLAYSRLGDLLSRSRVLSNIALAYSQLGDWDTSTKIIAESLNLLGKEGTFSPSDRDRTLAQVLNNQGIIQLNQGNSEGAIATWQQAAVNYRRVGDELGLIRTAINQGIALKNLGLYHRAVKILTQVEASLVQQPNSTIKAAGLRNYGDLLRSVGRIERSQEVLEQSLAVAVELKSTLEEVKTLLALGNTLRSHGNEVKALERYQQGLRTCQGDRSCLKTNLPLQINLAQFNLLLNTQYWQRSEQLIPEIQTLLNNLSPNKINLNHQINFAHNLIKLRQKAVLNKVELNHTPTWEVIETNLTIIIQQAVTLGGRRVESYAWGLQGQIDEQLGRWEQGRRHTQQALIIAQNLNAAEISYLWQWQLGRISQAQQQRSSAIAHYSQAVELLKSLSQDLVAIDPDLQYSFHETVEPVYRGLISLLLTNGHPQAPSFQDGERVTTNSEKTISQTNLEDGRNVIESLQLAELHNFFREACLDAQAVEIDGLDSHAAVIYPIILGDRLEVILSLPQQPLQHYSTTIAKDKLEKVIEQFRQSLVIRSRRKFYAPSRKLYDWLIRPALKDLIRSEIKTLVFVPDGVLRNIPLSALHDGKHYLIEQYSVALTPGLQLLEPRPLEKVQLKTIAAGLSKQHQGFSALNFVDSELQAIQEQVNSVILLNEDFTIDALQQEIKFSDYPIIHIATHGQFSSSLEDTFLLAWDSRININKLDNILQTRTPNQEKAIELLVLSACQTASGDKWAALGLAGMAVRAGARSTLATLWSVNDRATAELMSQFYQQLAQKPIAKAEAVRQAQLTLLHSRWYKHPFYWAPYVLLGNWL